MATITQPGDHTGEDAVTSHVNSHKLDGAEIICVIGELASTLAQRS